VQQAVDQELLKVHMARWEDFIPSLQVADLAFLETRDQTSNSVMCHYANGLAAIVI
jgi:hypothetical protein